MARKLTIELSEVVASRAEAEANRRGAPLDDVVEDALVEHLGWQAIEAIRKDTDLDEAGALRLAYEELDNVRRHRRPA